MTVKFQAYSAFSPTRQQVIQTSELVYQSLDMYSGIPIDQASCLSLIEEEISAPESECYDPMLALRGDDIVGLICYFDAVTLEARQKASMLAIMRRLDRAGRKQFIAQMKNDGYGVEALSDPNGVYISRVAVSDAHRGNRIGSKLLRHFIEKHEGQKIILHVDQSNLRASAFYQKVGFDFHAETALRKRLMVYTS